MVPAEDSPQPEPATGETSEGMRVAVYFVAVADAVATVDEAGESVEFLATTLRCWALTVAMPCGLTPGLGSATFR